ncbi:MAG: DUF4349 domain-containing protein [Actinomycetota bacterium]
MTRKRKGFAVVVLVFALASACTKTQSRSNPTSTLQYAPVPPQEQKSDASRAAAGAPSEQQGSVTTDAVKGPLLADNAAAPQGSAAIVDLPQAGNKVIKNADLRISVPKGTFQSRFGKISSIAEEFGGFVTRSSSESTSGKTRSGTITIRVPSDRFESAMAKVRGLGTVHAESQSGEDVTKQFVDLEARLAQAKAQEAFYLRLIDQSKTISDLIQVQQQLSQVQLQIEEIQGNLQFLKDQTSFSTLSIDLFEPGAGGHTPPKGIGKAWSEAIDGAKTVIGGLVVFVGWVAPIALLGLVLVGIYRLIRRRKDDDARTGDGRNMGDGPPVGEEAPKSG